MFSSEIVKGCAAVDGCVDDGWSVFSVCFGWFGPLDVTEVVGDGFRSFAVSDSLSVSVGKFRVIGCVGFPFLSNNNTVIYTENDCTYQENSTRHTTNNNPY